MLTKRIIPCLDVKEGRVVKGINFINLIDAGDPVDCAKAYSELNADELVFLDITATSDNRKTIINVIENVAKNVFIPFTVGGGVKTIDDIRSLLLAGADKVAINSSAVNNPKLINEASSIFGNQCIVVAIDGKYDRDIDGKPIYNVYINGGRVKTDLDVVSWAKEVENRGAGEILLTSMDKDGTKSGFDVELTKQVSDAVNIPVIASGGAGKKEDFKQILEIADAALAASLFHFNEININDLKKYLKDNNIIVR